MRKSSLKMFLFFFTASVLLCTSCDNQDSTIDCPIPAIALPSLFVELADADGNNLIATGALNTSNIQLSIDAQIIDAVIADATIPQLENTLIVPLTVGLNEVLLLISENETDTLSASLAINELPSGTDTDGCPILTIEATLTDVLYNEVPQTIENIDQRFLRITVVR